MSDLFNSNKARPVKSETYTAEDIEVLEGLEPVRRRPGMYIGGTDEHAMHHLVSEVFDNSMDEAVAGHASRIEMELEEDNVITIRDNGRGIPIDPHPKYPKKSALEVIFTMLHSGGKFSGKAYETSGGLHGVGVSVVNALSDVLEVEVVRDRTVYKQSYSRGEPQSKLRQEGTVQNRKGTSITFHPDPQIFGDKNKFRPEKLYKLARSKAYLFRGVEIRWKCAAGLLTEGSEIPTEDTIHFPGGLKDFLELTIVGRTTITPQHFVGEAELSDRQGRIEWALAWTSDDDEGSTRSYCNTIHTPEGGTHESGFKSAVTKSIKAYGERLGNKKAGIITGDDVFSGSSLILSLFIRDPQFQGQTKDKLVSAEAAKWVENVVRDHFDHWLAGDNESASALINYVINNAEDRLKRKAEKDVSRKSVTGRLRLPGKLADCTRSHGKDTEIFLVEGDSAGGSAKQARSRETQAVLPLRGKILNVASATSEKIRANQEIADMILALGCGTGKHYNDADLRYERIIIMTDADVDGAHIASLLMTFFYQEMPGLIRHGHLFLALPPLYRITHGTTTHYARDDKEKDALVATLSKKPGKLEIGRFKGLGEMTAAQLKETTMQSGKRVLLRVGIAEDEADDTRARVDQLMGKKPEFRFQFIQEETARRGKEISEQLDV
ncbi:MAG TPA: DNA topoisomerase IV subunit B [Rickettsiales bacterium]|nr:DNA topoisomerase IV subunit B [Rickettsiales bacterium]